MRKYGVHDTPEDPKRCIKEIWGKDYRQCQRKRGYGPEGLFCLQHAKIREKDKEQSNG